MTNSPLDPGELQTRLTQVVAQIRALRSELAEAQREEDLIRELLELPLADPGTVSYPKRQSMGQLTAGGKLKADQSR
jgi:hypothetical protein